MKELLSQREKLFRETFVYWVVLGSTLNNGSEKRWSKNISQHELITQIESFHSETARLMVEEFKKIVGEELKRPFDVEYNRDETGAIIFDDKAFDIGVKLLRDNEEAYRRMIINNERTRILQSLTELS